MIIITKEQPNNSIFEYRRISNIRSPQTFVEIVFLCNRHEYEHQSESESKMQQTLPSFNKYIHLL